MCRTRSHSPVCPRSAWATRAAPVVSSACRAATAVRPGSLRLPESRTFSLVDTLRKRARLQLYGSAAGVQRSLRRVENAHHVEPMGAVGARLVVFLNAIDEMAAFDVERLRHR